MKIFHSLSVAQDFREMLLFYDFHLSHKVGQLPPHPPSPESAGFRGNHQGIKSRRLFVLFSCFPLLSCRGHDAKRSQRPTPPPAASVTKPLAGLALGLERNFFCIWLRLITILFCFVMCTLAIFRLKQAHHNALTV